MSTTTSTDTSATPTPGPAAPTGASLPALDPEATRIPFARLVGVELRKMVDTRAGLWMLVVMSAVSVLVCAILLIWGEPQEQTLGTYLGMIFMPMSVLLPVLGIMSATQEWSHRTGLATFALVPRRGRVVAAKIAAALVLALTLLLIALVVATLSTLVSGGEMTTEGISGVGVVLTTLLFTLQGVAFGAALLSTPLAIVAILVLPSVWMVLTSVISWMSDASRWLDLNIVTDPLVSGTMTGENWGQLVTSAAVWVGLPLAIGTWRILTREIK